MPSKTLKVLYMRCLVAARHWVCLDEGENDTECNRTVTPGYFARGKYAARSDIGHLSGPSTCEFVDCMVDHRDGLLVL
jgi:hypothetical protein